MYLHASIIIIRPASSKLQELVSTDIFVAKGQRRLEWIYQERYNEGRQLKRVRSGTILFNSGNIPFAQTILILL